MAYIRIQLLDLNNGHMHRYGYVDDSLESEDGVTAAIMDMFPPQRYILFDFNWIGNLTYNKMQQLWPDGEVSLTPLKGDLDDFLEEEFDEDEEREEDDHPPDPNIRHARIIGNQFILDDMIVAPAVQRAPRR